MSYKLPKGIKPPIDMLGDNYINVDPRKLQGDDQALLDASFEMAKLKFARAGFIGAGLNFDNLEIRVWPGRQYVAFCFGIHVAGGKMSHVVLNPKLKGDMQAWLMRVGALQQTH